MAGLRTPVGAAAFVLLALSVALPSGYAWGASALLLLSGYAAPRCWRMARPDRATLALGAVIALMGLVWLLGSDLSKGLSALNKPLRYVLALPCLFVVWVVAPRLNWLYAGLAAGAAAGGLRALWDVGVVGLERAWGYDSSPHNAIQSGNLSGLLGVLCGVVLLVQYRRWSWPVRAGLAVAALLGLGGSLLSMTRGGWLGLGLGLLVLAGLLLAHWPLRRLLAAGAVALVVLLPLLSWQGPRLAARWAETRQEIQAYRTQHQVSGSSIGQRLEHWQLAWDMGWRRPWTGWGDAGYEAEKRRVVAAGQADPFVLQFGHAHNELVDQFAKRGLPGVAVLLLFYAVPLGRFWPTRRRLAGETGGAPGEALTLRLLGVLVPLAFAGFGLTQVFFAHYSGNLMYLFLLILLHGGLASLRVTARR